MRGGKQFPLAMADYEVAFGQREQSMKEHINTLTFSISTTFCFL
jgi:hypothetical protein